MVRTSQKNKIPAATATAATNATLSGHRTGNAISMTVSNQIPGAASVFRRTSLRVPFCCGIRREQRPAARAVRGIAPQNVRVVSGIEHKYANDVPVGALVWCEDAEEQDFIAERGGVIADDGGVEDDGGTGA